MIRSRREWSQKVDDVVRSRHYTWLGRGLGGEPLEQAMASLTADMMHICQRQGIPWKRVLEEAKNQFEQEEGDSVSQN